MLLYAEFVKCEGTFSILHPLSVPHCLVILTHFIHLSSGQARTEVSIETPPTICFERNLLDQSLGYATGPLKPILPLAAD